MLVKGYVNSLMLLHQEPVLVERNRRSYLQTRNQIRGLKQCKLTYLIHDGRNFRIRRRRSGGCICTLPSSCLPSLARLL